MACMGHAADAYVCIQRRKTAGTVRWQWQLPDRGQVADDQRDQSNPRLPFTRSWTTPAAPASARALSSSLCLDRCDGARSQIRWLAAPARANTNHADDLVAPPPLPAALHLYFDSTTYTCTWRPAIPAHSTGRSTEQAWLFGHRSAL